MKKNQDQDDTSSMKDYNYPHDEANWHDFERIRSKKSKNELEDVGYRWFESLNDFSEISWGGQSDDSLVIPHEKFPNSFNIDVAAAGDSEMKFEKLRFEDGLKLR